MNDSVFFDEKLNKRMESIAMNEFRRQVCEFVNQTYYAHKSFVLMKGQKPMTTLMPMSALDRLAQLEEWYAQAVPPTTIHEPSSTTTPSNPLVPGQ